MNNNQIHVSRETLEKLKNFLKNFLIKKHILFDNFINSWYN